MADFTGESGRSSPELAVQNDCAADAVSNHHVEQIATATAGADFELAIRGRVCIVFKFNSQACCSSQLFVQVIDAVRREIARSYNAICLPVDETGNRDADRRNCALARA